MCLSDSMAVSGCSVTERTGQKRIFGLKSPAEAAREQKPHNRMPGFPANIPVHMGNSRV